MKINNSIPDDILKIQKKLCEYETGSRNYTKYKKILQKHIKKFSMQKRVNSNIKTISTVEKLHNNS